MATLGQVTGTVNTLRDVCVLASATAVNGQPTGTTDGVQVFNTNIGASSDIGICAYGRPASEASIFAKAVGTAGTVAATLRFWGYKACLGEWIPIGTGADTTKGTINLGVGVGETKTDKALHSEPFAYVGHFDRIYVEVTAISGTGTSVDVWITTPRSNSY